MIYVGTTDPKSTPEIEHRSSLLSAVTFEARTPIDTRHIVPAEAWRRTTEEWGGRWEWSFPIVTAYEFIPFPDARRIMPKTYSQLGQLTNLGRCVTIDPGEIQGLLHLDVYLKPLKLQQAVTNALLLNADDRDVQRALSALALSIQDRISRSELERSGYNPVRTGPNISDVVQSLNGLWGGAQSGQCKLCGAAIQPKAANRLMRPSADRVDSSNKAYELANMQLTHLGCTTRSSAVVSLAENKCRVRDVEFFRDGFA